MRPRSRCSASTASGSRSRPTSTPGCPRSRSSACATPPCRSRASACGRRSSTPGFEFPLRRITVNLAPADLRKAGPAFDLALAAALLAASGQVPRGAARRPRVVRRARPRRVGAPRAGRDRDGRCRRDRGVRGHRGAARRTRARRRWSAALDVVPVGTLRELAAFLAGDGAARGRAVDAARLAGGRPCEGEDFAQVRGHHALKRALEVAAAGGHNVLMMGPPGSGKSMAARRLPSILPPLQLRRGAGGDARAQRRRACSAPSRSSRARPFRAPHHSISAAGAGGRRRPAGAGRGEPRPARRAVPGRAVGVLAARARGAAPAARGGLRAHHAGAAHGRFPGALPARGRNQPVSVRAPGRPRGAMQLPPDRWRRAIGRKLSGPLLDRIDMMLRVEQPRAQDVLAEAEPEGSRPIRERVIAARARAGSGACAGRGRVQRPDDPAQLRRLAELEPAARAALARRARACRPHDARPRPRAAGGAHARGPRRLATGCVGATSRRPSPTGSRRPRWTARWPDRRERMRRLPAPRRAAGAAGAMDRAGARTKRRRLPEVLALPDEELIDGGLRRQARGGRRPLARFDPGARARAGARRRDSRRVPARGRATRARCANAARRARGAVPDRATPACSSAATRAGRGDRGLAARSAYGMEVARALGRELAACGVPVVSGMALGVDSAAHEGALAGRRPDGRRDAGGADVAYPRGKRACTSASRPRGLVVSEMPPGMRPLQLVLSGPQPDHGRRSPRMTVVVEGTEGSGSLITARLRAGPRPRGGRRARAGHGPLAAGPNALLAEARAWCARPRTCWTRCTGRAQPAGRRGVEPRRRPGAGRRGWSRGCERCSRRSSRDGSRRGPGARRRTSPRCWPGSPSSSCSGSSRRGPGGRCAAVSDLTLAAWARAYA